MDLAYFLLMLSLVSLGSATVQLKVLNEDEKFQFHYCRDESSTDRKCFDGSFSHMECKSISIQIDLSENTTVRLVSSGQNLFIVPTQYALYLNEYANIIFSKRPIPPLVFVNTIDANGSTTKIVAGERVILLKPIPVDSAKANPSGLEITCGRLEEISVNVPKNADVNTLYELKPALFWAVIWGDLETVKSLITKVPATHKKYPMPIVHSAARSCNEDVLSFLLERGEHMLEYLFLPSPLMSAVYKGCVQNAKLILKNYTIPLKEINWRNEYVLEVAAKRYDDPDLVDLLISNGANTTRKDKEGRNSLHLAALAGHGKVVKKLVERGVPVDVMDDQGRTPLMLAAEAGKEETVKDLIALGADVEAVDSIGNSTIKYAEKYPAITDIIKSKIGN